MISPHVVGDGTGELFRNIGCVSSGRKTARVARVFWTTQ